MSIGIQYIIGDVADSSGYCHLVAHLRAAKLLRHLLGNLAGTAVSYKQPPFMIAYVGTVMV
jgi:hypothetical protein